MADDQQLEDPYRALIRKDKQQGASELAGAVASPVAPDARAQAVQLADKYKVPLDLVERNPDVFKQRAREDVPAERRLLQLNPKLADWLRESPAAAAAADDLPKLQELDNRLTFGASILRGIDNSQAMFGAFLEATGELGKKYTPGIGVAAEQLTRYGRAVRTHNEQQAQDLGYKSSFSHDAIKGPWELVQYLKETVGEQIPVMAPLIAAGAAGGQVGAAVGTAVPIPVIGTVGGAVLGAVIGAAIPAFVMGVGETEQNLKQLDPNAQAPELVFLGGSAVAAFDTALPGHLGSKLVRTFGRETAEAVAKKALLSTVAPRFFRGVAGEGVTGLATEAVTEALQEAIGGVTAAAGAGKDVDWRQLGEQMLEAGVAGGLMGAGSEAIASAAMHPREKARFAAAQQSEAFFTALGQSVVDSKLYGRLPAASAEFIARVTKDGPIETVYAPTDTFVEYWQSQGVDPATMAAELTGKANALEHALETRADLAIPLSTYATKLAATDHNTFFARELKLAPHLMNARQAQELQAAFEKVQATGEQAPAFEGPVTPGVAEVGRRIQEQALAAGESDQVAGAWSQLYESVYGQLATRYKRDALQLFEARPLSIQRDDGVVFTPMPAGQRTVVDIPRSEATPNETPSQRRIRRQAHLEALHAAYVRDARALDPDIDPAQIRHELELRLELNDTVAEAQQESGRGQDLLRAIAAYGGISTRAVEGEFRELATEGHDRRRRGPVMTKHGERQQTFGRKEWNGIAGVFTDTGLAPDDMVRSLMQDPKFAHLEDDLNALYPAIVAAMRAKQDTDVFPGTEELQELGIVPGEKWWSDSWQRQDAVDETPTEEGDTSFNVDELEQRGGTPQRLQQQLEKQGWSVDGEPGRYHLVDERVDDTGRATGKQRAPSAKALQLLEALNAATIQPRPLEESVGRVRDLELAATEEALGVVIPGETIDPLTNEPYQRASGDSYFIINGQPRYDMSAVNCTHMAEAFLETSGAAGVIVGYDDHHNDGKLSKYSGHDFAIVEGRFLVDPWAHQVEGSNPRAVFDLADPQDLAFVRQQYANPAGWVQRTSLGGHEWAWHSFRNDYLEETTPAPSTSTEFAQTEIDRRRSHRGPLEEAITRVRMQDRAIGSAFFEEGMHPETRIVPLQVVNDYRTVFRAFAAADTLAGAPTDKTVPVDQVWLGQPTFDPRVVEQYLASFDKGEQHPRPLAVQVEDRFYVTAGHSETIAQWARGVHELELRVVDSGMTVDQLQDTLVGDKGRQQKIGDRANAMTASDEAMLAASQTVNTRGTAADIPDNPTAQQLEAERQEELRKWLEENPHGAGEEFFQIEREFPDGFEVVAEHLTAREASRLRHGTAQQLLDVFETLPLDSDYEDAATAAVAKKGWYERSTKALRAVFGPVDSVRFAALLAAMSPKTSVEQNLLNALRLWVNWEEADRPTAPAAVRRLLGRSVQAGGVLPAWSQNVVRALRAEDPLAIQLSGPKVDSFMHNLWGHMNHVTNDAWMATFALVHERVLSGRMQAIRDESGALVGGPKMRGANPGYLALSVKIRRVARSLTRKTGITWTPANVQEAVWSWAKTLYELADAEGSSAVRVLKEGGLTDAAIAQTPDFEQLFVMDAEVREILEAGGYGEVLETLERAVGRAARRRHAATGGVDQATARGVTPALLRSAKRLDTVRKERRARSERERNEGLKRASSKIAKARAASRGRRGEFYQLDTSRFATKTDLVPTGQRELPVSRVNTPDQAAAAMGALNVNATERFDALVTDEAGATLAIVGSFKGRVDSVAVHPDVLIAEAVRVEGAANIWFVHNHPSGWSALSQADHAMANRLTQSFADTGIRARGILAIGEGGTWSHYDPEDGSHLSGDVRVPATEVPRTVPIVERQFASTGKLGNDAINSPQLAVARVPELAGGEFGVLLLDTRNRPIAFMQLDEENAGRLRSTGELRTMLEGLSIAGPTSAIVYVPGHGDQVGMLAGHNVAKALKFHEVDVVDMVVHNPQGLPISVRGHGGGGPLELEGEFFQGPNYTQLEGMHSRIVAAVQYSTLAKASGAQWKATIRNAGVNAEEYTAVAVDALEDGHTYTREELLEYVAEHQVVLEVLTLQDPNITDSEISERADRVFEQMAHQEQERLLHRDQGPPEPGEADAYEQDGQWYPVLRSDDGILDLEGAFDTRDEAMASAVEQEGPIREKAWDVWATDVRNSLSWDEAKSEALDQLTQERKTRSTQYVDYQEVHADPGSYREVFLTAPKARVPKQAVERAIVDQWLFRWENKIRDHTIAYGADSWSAKESRRQVELITKLLAAGDFTFVRGKGFASLTGEENEAFYQQNMVGVRQLETAQPFWYDGHSDYAFVVNPIVRVRFNARTSVDGTKTMFLEEVQAPSDDEQQRMPRLFRKSWRELAFKWALHHAAANGFDQVAWTEGDIQVERYSLARKVKRVTWAVGTLEGESRHYVTIEPTVQRGDPEWRSNMLLAVNAQGVVVTHTGLGVDHLAGKPLAEVIGREMAYKILNTPEGALEGRGLTIGGEGLRKLYDVDFPNVVNRLPAVKGSGVKAGMRPVPFGKFEKPTPAQYITGAGQQYSQAAMRWRELNPPTDDSRSMPGVRITPALREKLLAGQALFQPEDGGKKGAYNPATNVIRLISGKADLSTFLHESGHFFLEVLGDIAATVKADTEDPQEQQLLRDLSTVLREAGFQGTFEEWRALPVDARREVHEYFARGFEQYLSDGKAPSPALRDLFVRFRDWLVAVYRSAQGLGIEISPELRGVFDRLVASDEAIADAQHESQVTPLMTDAATAGVSPLEFEAYRAQVAEASRAAREELDRLLLRDWRREREAWWKAERQLVRAAVSLEVHQEPVYVAIAAMRHGRRPDGTPSYAAPMKLSRRAILNQYGRDELEKLRGKQVYSAEGGTHPDTAAELFGFATGQALIDAVATAKPMEQVIDQEADRRMRAKHGDLLLDGMKLQESAEAAVFEHRAKVISAELLALTAGMTGSVIPPAAIIKAQAEALIRRLPVRELKPGVYLNAARRASQSAFWNFGRNERRLAIRDKQQELVAMAHWRAARDAKERADSIRDRLKKYADKQSTRARIGRAGQEYLDQIDGFLERYEFARVSKKALERRRSLRDFVEQLQADGLPVQIPKQVLDDSQHVNWQELPLEQLEGIAAAVDQIAHLASLKNKLLKAKDARELQQVRTEIAASIREQNTARPQGHEPRSPAGKRAAFFDGIFASHRKVANIAYELDGFKDGGPMWEHVIRPLNEAANREATMNAEATRKLAEIFDRHYGTRADRVGLYKQQWIEALGPRDDIRAKLSKQGRLMVALNWGNETNRRRVLTGKNWTTQQVEEILATLDRRDWQFVQDVWDFVNGYWPEIEAKQRRVVGLAPTKVEATPVYTRFGEFRGGYFPLDYEGLLDPEVHNLKDAAAADMQKAAAYVHATTQRGHTEERSEHDVSKPVRLDFGVLFEHTTRVIHDLTHHEALIDVGRVVGSTEVSTAIQDTLGPEGFEQFRRTLKAVAVGDAAPAHQMEGFIAHLRSGATIVGLGWSVTTMAMQPLGLTQSIQRIGAKWVLRGMAGWLRGAVHMENVTAGIEAKSEFMANRMRTLQREVNEIRNRIDSSVIKHSGVESSFFYFIGKAQLVADVPTWLGAYEKAMANNATEDTAVQLADQAVRDSQGSGQQVDLAAVQRGSPAWKVWTNFYSFFNVTYNLWVDSLHQAKRDMSVAAIGTLAADYLLLFAVPAVLGHLLRGALTGDLFDEDEEELAAGLAMELGAYMAGTMIGLRELGGALQGYAGYEGPAGARGFATITRLATQVRQMEADEAFWRATNATAGVLFHYPAAQVERTFRGIKALIEGDTDNPLAVFVGPGKKK